MKVDKKIFIVLLACLILLVYANSFTNAFVWDDYSIIVNNDFVKSWKNLPRLFDKSYLTKASDLEYLGTRDIGSGELSYRPVVTLSYFIDFSLWGLNPFGYHLVNIVLHILNAMLLFIFIDLIIKNTKIAMFTCFFFAVHPVNTEAVDVISFREDLFVFLFFLSAFILYIKSRENMNGKKVALYALSLLMFLLALFSKETAMVFILVLLCYDYSFGKMPKGILAHLRNYYFGYAAVLVFYLMARFILMVNVGQPLIARPVAQFYPRIATMLKVAAAYAQWLLLPINVHPTLPDDPAIISQSLSEGGVLVSLSVILTLFGIILAIRKKMPGCSFAALWSLVTFIPVSNIFFPLTNYFAARYLYLPAVGFYLLAAAFLTQLPDFKIGSVPRDILKKVAGNAFIIILVFYSMFAALRNMSWKNNTVFWLEMAGDYPHNALAHSSLGATFRERGLFDKAVEEYKIALRLDPNYANDHNALGVCYYEMGMLSEAAEEFKKALKLDPGLISAYANLGSALGDKGLYQEALRCFEKAIQLDGKILSAYNGLGVTYARMQDYNNARQNWEKALQIDPLNKEARENLQKLKELKKLPF